MPAYPSQTENLPEENGYEPKLVKQMVIAAVLTLLLAGGWWYFEQLSAVMLRWMGFQSDLESAPSMMNFLSLFWIMELIWWQALLVGLGIWSVLWSLIVLEGLLISNDRVRLVPIIAAPQVLWLNNKQGMELWILLGVAILCQIVFMTEMVRGLDVFKKISLARLVLPTSGGLFFGLSVMLVIPMHFYLQTKQIEFKQTLEDGLVKPQIEKWVNLSTTLEETEEEDIGMLIDLRSINKKLSELMTPEIATKLKTEWQQSDGKGEDRIQTEIVGDLNKDLHQGEIELQMQIFEQVMRWLDPLINFIDVILPLLFFVSILQVVNLGKPFLFIFPWLFWQSVLGLRIARVRERQEPVEFLEV
jgi:hypothetical protein